MFSYTAIVIKWIELKVIYDCNRHRNPINRSIKSLFTQMEKYSNRKEKKQHIPDNWLLISAIDLGIGNCESDVDLGSFLRRNKRI